MQSNPYEPPEEQGKRKAETKQAVSRFKETLFDRIVGIMLLIGLIPILFSLFFFSPVNGYGNAISHYLDAFGELYGVLFGLFAIAYCIRRIFFWGRKYHNKRTR